MKTNKLLQYAAVALFALPAGAQAQLKPERAKEVPVIKAQLPDLQATDMSVNADCAIVVSFRNNGPGAVPDANFSTSPPSNSGIQMYRNGAPWGGIVLGAMDPSKSLKPAGGMLTFNWFSGLKLPPGSHTVKIDVDNNNKVVENNEGNNS
ncbi:MAG TPA: CARDB domain-containing protein, partial [Burkholderiales bacterium]|nr:CARDB domain-containing protein [Burkholderiales bacterium]